MNYQQNDQNVRLTRQVLFRNWRTFRSGMLALSKLEKQLALDIEALFRTGETIQEAQVQYWYLGNSVVTFIEVIDETTKAINFIRQAVERSEISDQEIEDKFSSYVGGKSNSEVIIRHIRHIGGYRAYLKRIATFLDSRRKSFVTCLGILNKVDRKSDQKVLIGDLALQVRDCMPGGSSSEDPGVAYSFVCLAGLWGLAFCAAVVLGTLIVLEGEAEGDDDDDGEVGDFPEPDPDGDRPA